MLQSNGYESTRWNVIRAVWKLSPPISVVTSKDVSGTSHCTNQIRAFSRGAVDGPNCTNVPAVTAIQATASTTVTAATTRVMRPRRAVHSSTRPSTAKQASQTSQLVSMPYG
jgi:hypothetical protein